MIARHVFIRPYRTDNPFTRIFTIVASYRSSLMNFPVFRQDTRLYLHPESITLLAPLYRWCRS
nr:MAG TPA: hypothetical protein [Caudoviricetes sp.]